MAMMFRGLDEDSYDRQYTDAELFRRIGSYFAQYELQIGVIFTTALAGAVMLSLRPVIIAAGVGAISRNTEFSTLWLLIGALLVTVLVEYAGNYVRRRLAARAIGGTVANMRKDAFAAAVNRDLSFYDKNKSGKVVSRITSDTQEFGTVVVLASDLFSQIASVLVLVAILFSRSVPLTLLTISLAPFIVVGSLTFRHYARITTRDGARALGLVNDNIQESVAGIGIAKNFRRESTIYTEFDGVNQTSYRVNLRRGAVLSSIFPVLNLLAGVAFGIITYFGARAVISDSVTPDTWYLFIQSVDRFWFPFISLSAFISQFQQGLASAERVFALIDADNNLQQTGEDRAIAELHGEIEFDNVTFGYTLSDPVLQDF
ncbi:MAG: ABC transporter ATP-binding protein, partial [Chloroflexota bacterium]